jgi:hypothetical protein
LVSTASGSAALLSARPWDDPRQPHPKHRMPQSQALKLEQMA